MLGQEPVSPSLDSMGRDRGAGINLRDYLAARAMQGMVSNLPRGNCGTRPEYIARAAYAISDAMIEESQKKENEDEKPLEFPVCSRCGNPPNPKAGSTISYDHYDYCSSSTKRSERFCSMVCARTAAHERLHTVAYFTHYTHHETARRIEV